MEIEDVSGQPGDPSMPWVHLVGVSSVSNFRADVAGGANWIGTVLELATTGGRPEASVQFGIAGEVGDMAALIACIERSAANAGHGAALSAALDQVRADMRETDKRRGKRS